MYYYQFSFKKNCEKLPLIFCRNPSYHISFVEVNKILLFLCISYYMYVLICKFSLPISSIKTSGFFPHSMLNFQKEKQFWNYILYLSYLLLFLQSNTCLNPHCLLLCRNPDRHSFQRGLSRRTDVCTTCKRLLKIRSIWKNFVRNSILHDPPTDE